MALRKQGLYEVSREAFKEALKLRSGTRRFGVSPSLTARTRTLRRTRSDGAEGSRANTRRVLLRSLRPPTGASSSLIRLSVKMPRASCNEQRISSWVSRGRRIKGPRHRSARKRCSRKCATASNGQATANIPRVEDALLPDRVLCYQPYATERGDRCYFASSTLPTRRIHVEKGHTSREDRKKCAHGG
jgi:hypothetical protein